MANSFGQADELDNAHQSIAGIVEYGISANTVLGNMEDEVEAVVVGIIFWLQQDVIPDSVALAKPS